MYIVSILLLIPVSTCQDSDVAGCDLLVIYPNSSQDNPLTSSGCNFLIQESHNWTMLDLQLDSANPDWKDMFRGFDNQTACLRFPTSYTVNKDIGLYYLEIGVECRGEPQTKGFTLEPMLWKKEREEYSNVFYNEGRYNLRRDCINFGIHQYKLDVGTSLQIIQNASTGFINLGKGSNESSDLEGNCNCTGIKAYEELLKKCVSAPFVDLEKNVTKRDKVKFSSYDSGFGRIIPIALVGVGVFLVFVIYGSKYIESGRN